MSDMDFIFIRMWCEECQEYEWHLRVAYSFWTCLKCRGEGRDNLKRLKADPNMVTV